MLHSKQSEEIKVAQGHSRASLCRLVAQYGGEVVADVKRCEGLIRDLCPESRRDANVLILALREHVPADLLAPSGGVPKGALLARLSNRLGDNLGLDREFAKWAVESWAVALGVIRATDSPRATDRTAAHAQAVGPDGLDLLDEGQTKRTHCVRCLEPIRGKGMCPRCRHWCYWLAHESAVEPHYCRDRPFDKVTLRPDQLVMRQALDSETVDGLCDRCRRASANVKPQTDPPRARDVNRPTISPTVSPTDSRPTIGSPPQPEVKPRSGLGVAVGNTGASVSTVTPANADHGELPWMVILTLMCVLGIALTFWFSSRLRERRPLVDRQAATSRAPLAGSEVAGEHPGAQPAPKSVAVPAGNFWMGCNERVDKECYDKERPGHEVSVAAFEIDRTEVTVAAYRRCVDAGACSAPDTGHDCNWSMGRENHPVNCVDWSQATAYCKWAGGRLPTEAEWEKAARGTDGRKYPWGNTDVRKSRAYGNVHLNASGDIRETVPVGTYPAGASPYGALDMIGNVDEWVDGKSRSYPWAPGEFHRLKGSSWYGTAESSRASAFGEYDYQRVPFIGFRCARAPHS